MKLHWDYFSRQIPKQGNTAELVLSVLHRNFLGLDQFLGQTTIPLADIDVYERPKSMYVYASMEMYSTKLCIDKILF